MISGKIDVFFYGLFLDEGILKAYGIDALNQRKAKVEDYSLLISDRATLSACTGSVAYGMVYSISHADIEKLYSGPGLEAYKPEALLVGLENGEKLPALCFNLIDNPISGEENIEYAGKLRQVLGRNGFPQHYIDSI